MVNLVVEENAPITLSADTDRQVNLSAESAISVTTNDYDRLTHKPQVEGVELVGNKTLNNLGAYTQAQINTLLADKADASDVPTKVSDLTNDSGYISSYTETDPIFLASVAHGISSSDISNWNGKSDFSGSYNDLTDNPTIPTKTSDLTNDSGFITLSDLPIYNGGVV